MKKILAILITAAMVITCAGCESDTVIAETMPGGGNKPVAEGGTEGGDVTDLPPDDYVPEEYDRTLNSMIMALDESGNMKISRYAHSSTAPMGGKGTWTVFVYLCGGTYEELYGAASADIDEMITASSLSDIKFVVQTGGAEKWTNTLVNPAHIQRFVISGGKIELDDEQAEVNMGDSSALSAFLAWGVEEHPAENMGVVFWGKGGGCTAGVCFDPRYGNDSLSLREIDAALLTVYEKMTDKFEFIGFDASLMSTIETANIMATYADYMFASQEIQPEKSWDYTAFGDHLVLNPEADGSTLGCVIGDYYLKSCKDTMAESFAGFSVIRLSEIDGLIGAFNSYFQMLYAMTDEAAILAEFSRGICNADSFGGNSTAEGYTNLIDLKDSVNASPDYIPGKDAVLTAIDNAVVYAVNGSMHSSACGISVYYPLNINTGAELSAFTDVAVSPYHLAFVDRVVNGVYSGAFDSTYTSETLMDEWGDLWYPFENFYEATVYQDYEYTYKEEYYDDYYYHTENYDNTEYWNYADSCAADGDSGLIEFSEDITTDDSGSYCFTLTEDALYNTESVHGYVYELSENGEELYDYGVYTDVEGDWKTGYFSDGFDGKWIALPDGQVLAVYPAGKTDEGSLYTSLVLVNGEETNLRIVYDKATSSAYIDSMWRGMDDYGCPETGKTSLAAGDVIVPLYFTRAVFSEDEYYTEGLEYKYDGNTGLSVTALDGEDYYFGYYINDICGNYYTIDYEYFYFEDGVLMFR